MSYLIRTGSLVRALLLARLKVVLICLRLALQIVFSPGALQTASSLRALQTVPPPGAISVPSFGALRIASPPGAVWPLRSVFLPLLLCRLVDRSHVVTKCQSLEDRMTSQFMRWIDSTRWCRTKYKKRRKFKNFTTKKCFFFFFLRFLCRPMWFFAVVPLADWRLLHADEREGTASTTRWRDYIHHNK